MNIRDKIRSVDRYKNVPDALDAWHRGASESQIERFGEYVREFLIYRSEVGPGRISWQTFTDMLCDDPEVGLDIKAQTLQSCIQKRVLRIRE